MTVLPASSKLSFRLWTASDGVIAGCIWKDAEVMQHMGGPLDDAGVQSRLDREISNQERFGFQYWPMFLRETGEFVGCSGFRPFHEQPGVLELGVHLARRFWSARLGEEAALATTRYGFETLGAQVIVGGHGPLNHHSRALMLRLGFNFTHEEPWGQAGLLHPYYKLERT